MSYLPCPSAWSSKRNNNTFSGRFEPAVICDSGFRVEQLTFRMLCPYQGQEVGWHRKRKGGTEIGCSAEADVCVLQTAFEQLDCLGLVETQLLCLGEAQLLVTRVGYSLFMCQVRLQFIVSVTTLGLGFVCRLHLTDFKVGIFLYFCFPHNESWVTFARR